MEEKDLFDDIFEDTETEEVETNDFEAIAEENYNKYLRAVAEFDNFKKRTQKEKDELYSFAVSDTVSAILPVIDNLERAIAAAENAEDGMKQGVEMVLTQFREVLNKIGVTEIEAVGKPFNPELHNAVMHTEDESLEPNTVVEEFAKGYKYKDKVIRYSMVKVAN